MREYLYSFILPQSLLQVSQLLKVKAKIGLPVFGEEIQKYCSYDGKLTIPEVYKTARVNADFLIFVGFEDTPGTTLASASYCNQGKS